MNEPELSKFIEVRGLSKNVNDWTADIPELETSRPPLSTKLEQQLLRQSRLYLKQFDKKNELQYNLRKRVPVNYKY